MLSVVSSTIFQQLKALLVQLSPQAYAMPLDLFRGSSLGGHTRHIIEFYDCLAQGKINGIVNYDNRQRDLMIEQNLDYALQLIDRLILSFESPQNVSGTFVLQIKIGENWLDLSTTYEREEAYLIEHTIHHLAIIRMGIETVAPHLTVAPNFGVAFSTLEYKEQMANA